MNSLKGYERNYKPGQLLLVSDNVDCDPAQSWAVGYIHRIFDDSITIYNSGGILYRRWFYALPVTEEFGKQVTKLLKFRRDQEKLHKGHYVETTKD